jgi:hypothetical protein
VKVKICLAVLILLTAASAFAQTVDHTVIVAAAREQVVAIGINPDTDDCARWEVTRRVVIALASEGAGHIAKGGSNCRGYATDALMYADGTVVDVLGAGQAGPNTAHWMIQPGKRPASDWRPPVALEPTTVAAPPTPEPPPAVSAVDLTAVNAKLDQILYQAEQLRQQQTADTERILGRINEVVNNAKKSAPGFLAALAQVLTLGAKK